MHPNALRNWLLRACEWCVGGGGEKPSGVGRRRTGTCSNLWILDPVPA